MTYSFGEKNLGTAAANADAIRNEFVTAISAHPAYEHVEQVSGSAYVVDVIRSIGTLNGDGQDWYLIIARSVSNAAMLFMIAEDYDVFGVNASKSYISNTRITNTTTDGYAYPLGAFVFTNGWSGNNPNYAPESIYSITPGIGPTPWYVDVTNEYVLLSGYLIGRLEVPAGSRWRRNLFLGSISMSTGDQLNGGVIKGAYGVGASSLGQSVYVMNPSGRWAFAGIDPNFDEIPYSKVPVKTETTIHNGSILGYLPNILWIPYTGGVRDDTVTIEGVEYRLQVGYLWHKTGVA